MKDILEACVFAMKRLSDYTAKIVDPYTKNTIQKSTETFSQYRARCIDARDADINVLIESLFFFINSEKERSKDSKRLDWIEAHFHWASGDFAWPSADHDDLREAVDSAIERESADKTQASSENPESES